jgi:hypothetical protein
VSSDNVYGDHDDDGDGDGDDDCDDDVDVHSLKRKGQFEVLFTNNLKSPFLNVYRKIRNELSFELHNV